MLPADNHCVATKLKLIGNAECGGVSFVSDTGASKLLQ